jgi:3-oxoacyl-[acyl-carrier protein] reductase
MDCASLLTGKNILLTGGTRGIGLCTALALARAGANVAACSRHDDQAARSLAGLLAAIDGDHCLVRADVTVPDQVELVLAECGRRYGALDAVVNNVGTIGVAPFGDLRVAEWQRVASVNLTAAFLVTQRALPLLREHASVIYLGSRAAAAGAPQRAHYTAAKAALTGLVRSLARELGPRGIRANMVAPNMLEPETALPAAQMSRFRAQVALGRLARPEDVAGAVLFLASDLSRYVTGETIHVDGGM